MSSNCAVLVLLREGVLKLLNVSGKAFAAAPGSRPVPDKV